MDGYSRLVAWLKVLLPLAALAILSTLFLLSRNVQPIATIPFADNDIRERLESQRVTAPFFSGTTSGGDRVTIAAATLSTEGGTLGENTAEALTAQFDLSGGTRVQLKAKTGHISVEKGMAELLGDVVVTTSTGFRLSSDRIDASTETLDVRSPGPVAGTGPFGDLDAGAMHLTEPDAETGPQLFFTNGVKLLYQPQGLRE